MVGLEPKMEFEKDFGWIEGWWDIQRDFGI